MCLTDKDTAAVNAEGKIEMIKVKDNILTRGRGLTVSKTIIGLTSSRNSLVVSYVSRPWVLYDINGWNSSPPVG